MIGLIPRVLCRMVAGAGGEESLLRVKQAAGVPPDLVFRMNEPCPDEQWQRLFRASCEVLEVTPIHAEHLFAKTFLAFALEQFPKWFEMCHSAREFLEFQPTLHNSFATGLQDPQARFEVKDKFRISTSAERIVVHYRSPNQLCGLYMPLAHLVIQHYGDLATVREADCMKRGDDECVIIVHWFDQEH
jgi:hypothetical protein